MANNAAINVMGKLLEKCESSHKPRFYWDRSWTIKKYEEKLNAEEKERNKVNDNAVMV